MSNKDEKKHQDQASSLSPMAAAVTGAIVGAGVAVAGAAVLADDKKRAKVKAVFNTVKDQAVDYVENMKDEVEDIKKGKK